MTSPAIADLLIYAGLLLGIIAVTASAWPA
jgi:hypothetical protein